jgi:hypothetical protein
MGSDQSKFLRSQLTVANGKAVEALPTTDARAREMFMKRMTVHSHSLMAYEYSKISKKAFGYKLSMSRAKMQNDEIKSKMLASKARTLDIDRSTRKLLQMPSLYLVTKHKEPKKCEPLDCIACPLLLCPSCEWPEKEISGAEQIQMLIMTANTLDTLQYKDVESTCCCSTVKSFDNPKAALLTVKMGLLLEAEEILDDIMTRDTTITVFEPSVESTNQALKSMLVKASSIEKELRLCVMDCILHFPVLEVGVFPSLIPASVSEVDESTLKMFHNNLAFIDEVVNLISKSFSVLTVRRRLKSGKKILSKLKAGKTVRDVYGVQLFVSNLKVSEIMLSCVSHWDGMVRMPGVLACRLKVSFTAQTSWLDFKLQLFTSKGLIMEVQVVPVKNFLADMDVKGHDIHDLKQSMERI